MYDFQWHLSNSTNCGSWGLFPNRNLVNLEKIWFAIKMHSLSSYSCYTYVRFFFLDLIYIYIYIIYIIIFLLYIYFSAVGCLLCLSVENTPSNHNVAPFEVWLSHLHQSSLRMPWQHAPLGLENGNSLGVCLLGFCNGRRLGSIN